MCTYVRSIVMNDAWLAGWLIEFAIALSAARSRKLVDKSIIRNCLWTTLGTFYFTWAPSTVGCVVAILWSTSTTSWLQLTTRSIRKTTKWRQGHVCTTELRQKVQFSPCLWKCLLRLSLHKIIFSRMLLLYKASNSRTHHQSPMVAGSKIFER